MRADPDSVLVRIRTELVRGHRSANELCQRLEISQPTLSRALRRMGSEVLVAGKGRKTRYALHRLVRDVTTPVPIYEMRSPPVTLGHLFPVQGGDAFYIESHHGDLLGGWYDDWPWFLYDLRPSGYIGRSLPQRYPHRGFPADVLRWSADHVLAYLTHDGFDAVGSLVLGDAAYTAWMEQGPKPVLSRGDYTRFATDALRWGPVGSSAAGEHPKFVVPGDPGFIVKFSPVIEEKKDRRRADLLIAEHHALEVLREHGISAANSDIFEDGGRIFLEVERFDRCGQERLGQITLTAFNAEFVGSVGDWIEACAGLHRTGHLSFGDLQRVRFIQRFGEWIANSDMHFSNLSFRTQGTRLLGLTPVYDMTPMLYQVAGAEIVERSFEPKVHPGDADIAHAVQAAALDFWARVRDCGLISEDFRRIAAQNRDAVEALSGKLVRLPMSGGTA